MKKSDLLSYLLPAAVVGGVAYYFLRPAASAGPQGSDKVVAAGEIPPDTSVVEDSSAASRLSADQLAKLKIYPSGRPTQTYQASVGGFAPATIYVTEHILNRATGSLLPDYPGFQVKQAHLRSIVDNTELQLVLNGKRESCTLWVAASDSAAACIAYFNFLRKFNPSFTWLL